MRVHLFLALGITICAASSLSADETEMSTKVDGTLVISENEGDFSDHVVDIRLYEYDPRLADARATLVERITIEEFSHSQGKETNRQFVIGAQGRLNPQKQYYVTLFVLKGDKRTHIGKVPGKDICKVLTNDSPRIIELDVKAIVD